MPIKADRKSREEWAELPAGEDLPLEVIEKPKKKPTKFDDGGEQVDFLVKVFDGPHADGKLDKPSKFHVYAGLTMAPSSDGTKSKLRQISEAVLGPLTDEQAWDVDVEQFGPSESKHGARFSGRFNYVTNPRNPEAKPAFKPLFFEKLRGSAATTAVSNGTVDEYQYNEGRTHRWKQGMAAWEPVPAAVVAPPPPPPPPAAAVAPPPPPPAAQHAETVPPTAGKDEIEF